MELDTLFTTLTSIELNRHELIPSGGKRLCRVWSKCTVKKHGLEKFPQYVVRSVRA